jgi:Tfp pilus assembly protein PilO
MRTSETKTFGMVAGTLCVLAFLALGGMLYAIQQKDATYTNQLRVRATAAATEKEAELLGTMLAETANDRAELTKYVLTEDSVVDFLSLIGDISRTQGVSAETRSLAVESIESTEVFENLTLEVDVTGSFQSVTEMLSVLESLPYQVRVESVTVERTSEAKGDTLWRGAYHLSVTKYK